MIQKTVSVGPLQCNCQILVCAKTRSGVIVDPGDEADKILKNINLIETSLGGQKISVKALLHTHAHFDHMGATRAVATSLQESGVDAPTIFLHQGDEFIYQMLQKQGEMFGFRFEAPLPVDHFLNHEEEMNFGTLRFQTIHTPGHSPGGVCFRLRSDPSENIPEAVFSGDTLFHRSIGRSDLWGGDSDLLLKSIRNRLFTLDGDTLVYPGHGPSTRMGDEKLENPYAS